MKKLLLLLSITFVTISMSIAQMQEGHIAYDIEMSSDDPESESVIGMFSGSTMNLYFSGDLARTEIDFGAFMSMSTVVNNKTNEIMILMGGMMGQKGVLTTATEMNVDETEEPEITVTLQNETKKILDYKCKKAIITDAEGNEMIYWYTDKIKTVTTDKNTAVSKLPGLALEYAVDRDGLLMTFTAKAVKESLDQATKTSKLSLIIPEGYEVMTYEEFNSFGQ